MRGAPSFGRPSSGRPGSVLLEAVLVAAVAALGAFLFPLLGQWHEERTLDLAAAEVSALIRSVQADARNGESAYTGTSLEYKDLVFTMNGGRVQYYGVRGIRSGQPRGWLAEGITMSPVTVQLRFMKNSFAGHSDNYSFRLYGPRRASARQVTVAMYTGRVRVETVNL